MTDSVVRIGLASGRFALIDAADAAFLNRFKWHVSNDGYARTKVSGAHVLMHHLVVPPVCGWVTDHINRDRLDNRSANLRHATNGDNNRNRAGVRGCVIDRRRKTKIWQARMRFNGRSLSLGYFNTEAEATEAYKAALIAHGLAVPGHLLSTCSNSAIPRADAAPSDHSSRSDGAAALPMVTP